jgi:hypothetical protein
MQTADKLIEVLLFVALGIGFYWWQMRQIRMDRRKAAEQAAQQARGEAPPSRESTPGGPQA